MQEKSEYDLITAEGSRGDHARCQRLIAMVRILSQNATDYFTVIVFFNRQFPRQNPTKEQKIIVYPRCFTVDKIISDLIATLIF